MTRLVDAWREMSRERRSAALAAVALLVTMFFPWYQQNAVAAKAGLESRNLDAFQVFSFVEAAVLLVSVSVCYLLFARADGRDFQLPGGDGAVVLAAGLWTALLLIFRLFDKPGISSNGVAANVGVQWGIFFALAAAGLLAYSGQRMRPARPHRGHPPRHAARTEAPPTDTAEDEEEGSRGGETEVLRPREERPRYPPAPATAAGRAPRRTRAPEQLSFEEPPPPEE